jgi:hypothetical protein
LLDLRDPYCVSGDVPASRDLAHGDISDLEQTGMGLHLEGVARRIDPDRRASFHAGL